MWKINFSVSHACSNLKEIVKHSKITSVNWQTFDFKIFFFFKFKCCLFKHSKFQFFPSKSLNVILWIWMDQIRFFIFFLANRVVFLTNCRIMRRCNFYFQWNNRDSIRRKMDSIDSWFQLSISSIIFLCSIKRSKATLFNFP